MDHDFSIAELTDDRVPAVVDLCRTALDLPEDAAEAGPIVARLRERAAPAGAGTGRGGVGLAAVAGGALVGVALGSTSHRDHSIGHVDLVAVAAPMRRRGIGRALLGRMEARLAALGATEVLLAGNPPQYAWPGIDVRYTPAVCAALALGYEQHRTSWNMTVDLSHPAAPALRDTAPAERRLAERGIAVRRAEPEDVAALVHFAQGTFGAAWGAEVSQSVGRPGTGCHLATGQDGDVLGFAAYGSSRPSWFGPMGTSPAARGLGIGAVLLRRCLRDQRAAGHERVEIGWVGPLRFYSDSVAARIERVFLQFRKQL